MQQLRRPIDIIMGRDIRKDTKCFTCPSTKIKVPDDFKDEISIREFGISHMCQECQDLTFVPEEEL